MVGSAVNAHIGDPQFIPQVPNPGSMTIDGSDDDWAWMDRAFAFTSDKMVPGGNEPDFTRSDFDVVYFLGWSAPPENMIYLFARVTDDFLDLNEDNPNWWWADDSFNLAIDSDHSGGDATGTEIEHIQNAQRWQVRILAAPAGAENGEFGTTGMYHGPSIYQGLPELAWAHLDPFGSFSSTIEPGGFEHGAADVTYTYELRMGIWDFFGLSADESTRHILAADQTIGFQCQFGDSDLVDARNENGWDSNLTIGGGHANASEYFDHILVGADGATAVEMATWGRVKSVMKRRLE